MNLRSCHSSKVLRGVRVFAPLAPVFGEFSSPKILYSCCQKYHLPPQKLVNWISQKGLYPTPLKRYRPKTKSPTTWHTIPAIYPPPSRHKSWIFQYNLISFLFGGGDGRNVPKRRVTMVPAVFCVIKVPLASQLVIPWLMDLV